MVYGRVSADTKTCGSPLNLRLLAVPFDRLRTGYICLLAPKGLANILVF